MRIALLIVLVWLLATPSVTSGQNEETVQSGIAAEGQLGSTMTLEQIQARKVLEEEAKATAFRVTAAPEVQPAFKYRFWRPDFELVPGSAQLHFYRALAHYNQIPSETRQLVESWAGQYDARTKKPSQDDVQNMLDEKLRFVFNELSTFSQCDDQSWDHRFRDLRGEEYFSYPLPDVQQSRALARILQVKAHYEIENARFEDAIETLQIGFRLARFVGQGEMLVQQLVGIAIHGIMVGEVEQMIQVEGSPNLYWALATLPRPFVDVNRSIEFELSSIGRMFPVLEEAETSENNDSDYWADAWGRAVREMVRYGGIDDMPQQLAATALGVTAVKPARESLLAAGMDPNRVAALAPMRAVLLAGNRDIRERTHELLKANKLPGNVRGEIADRPWQDFQKWLTENMTKSAGAWVMGLLVPAVQAAESAGIRSQYAVDRLMNVEALRMHAAVHASLPERLNELDQAPALLNIYTNKPFDYQKQQTGFLLSADVPVTVEFMRQVKVWIQLP